MNRAAEKYGWSWRETMFDTPLSAILLMLRQERVESGKIFTLSEIEEIDNGR